MRKETPHENDRYCRKDNMITGEHYRFSILTPQLVRMEYSRDGVFEDRPTQKVLQRNFETPDFNVYEGENQLEIDTEWLSISYDKKEFSIGGLSVKVRSESRGIYSTWHFSESVDEGLWGTTRTLDQADGAIPLDAGLQSRLSGFGVLDDSKSLILLENGWIEQRKANIQDVYFFGYGYGYRQCLRDFFHLCGKTPLLPRYALGNWWSRFYQYTDSEYNALMDRFTAEEVPLSVAVIDMDWHLRDIDPKYGKGWTGYTWNSSLFPNPKEFLGGLHNRKLKVTLNLHPAEGVQPHEQMYDAMALALGREPEQKQPIHFDFCDRAFIDAYFKYLHHPQEEKGVDFWWIDWQQGNASRIPGADPGWMLNHFHFQDSAKNGKRPMIFSRYEGPGSHRYPVGFSGDTVISWESLQFQPYFTATASNIGYGWWSHDIGGHASGSKDGELIARWVQFGVFSPIMRLHSTSNMFNGKEPWKFSEPSRSIMTYFMQLRHKLIPYIYTMNWRCHTKDELLIEPMYYSYPDQEEAYEVPNQYEFGSELIVCPITSPVDVALQTSYVKAWLPEGTYFDLFTGMRYRGGRLMNLYRPIDQIPVLAKAGAIIPMTGEKEAKQNGVELPVQMDIKVFAGANGNFELYEDDGESTDYNKGNYALTYFDFVWNDGKDSLVTIKTSKCIDLLPKQRQYIVSIIGVTDSDDIYLEAGDTEITYSKEYDIKLKAIVLTLSLCDVNTPITVGFISELSLAEHCFEKDVFDLLNTAQIGYEEKEKIYNCISGTKNTCSIITSLQAMGISQKLIGAISEIIFAQQSS